MPCTGRVVVSWQIDRPGCQAICWLRRYVDPIAYRPQMFQAYEELLKVRDRGLGHAVWHCSRTANACCSSLCVCRRTVYFTGVVHDAGPRENRFV